MRIGIGIGIGIAIRFALPSVRLTVRLPACPFFRQIVRLFIHSSVRAVRLPVRPPSRRKEGAPPQDSIFAGQSPFRNNRLRGITATAEQQP